METPKAPTRYSHSLPCFKFEEDRYRSQQERTVLDVDKVIAPLGPARPLEIDERFPQGYDFFQRDALLLNGDQITIFYSIAKDHIPSAIGFERSRGAIIAAFIWVLETPAFAGNSEPSSGERGEEIGAILSAAIAYGLSEAEALICYNTAYIQAKQSSN